MEETVYLLLLGLVLAVLIPIVPSLVRLRIRALYWMRWDSLARFHEQNFLGIVKFAQVSIAGVIIVLLGIIALS
jgi:hypothetical protein